MKTYIFIPLLLLIGLICSFPLSAQDAALDSSADDMESSTLIRDDNSFISPIGGADTPASLGKQVLKTAGSLLLVVALLVVILFLVKKFLPVGKLAEDAGAIDIISRTAINSKTQIFLVRIHKKAVAFAVSNNSTTKLLEFTDQDEIDALALMAQRSGGKVTFTSFLNKEEESPVYEQEGLEE